MKKRKELINRIAYACGDIYGGGAFIIIGLLLLVYLTNVVGFSGTLAGIIVFIGKAWDAIIDPLYGATVGQNPVPFWSSPHIFPAGWPSCFRLLGNAMVLFWYHRDHG